jgi:hypothetical protein
MKTRNVCLLAATLAAAGALWWNTAATGADTSTAEVMKQKLAHAQDLLRGISLEDYAAIEVSARKLKQLSQATGWFARQTPEYELFTAELRRQTDALERAAKNRNIDAATLAYFQLTVSCVSCHKYLRGAKVVRLDAPSRAAGL